jgi:hypothetical protein
MTVGTMTARLLASLALVLSAAGCGEKITQEYRIQLVGPLDMPTSFLDGATTGVLEAGGKKFRTPIMPGVPFAVTGAGIDLKATPNTVFKFQALDATDKVVAQGQSPEIELVLATPPVVLILVQKPGSFGRTYDLDYPRRELAAAPIRAVPKFMPGLPITVGFFGLGRVITATGMPEQVSEAYALYNPMIHGISSAGMSLPMGNLRQPRTDAATVVHGGQVLIFGGEATPPGKSPGPTAQLDIVTMERTGFDTFQPHVENPKMATAPPGVARSRTALVDLEAAYAFGGRAGDQLLDTVVKIDPVLDEALALLPVRMAGPREGHTATVAAVQAGREVLVFGGAAAAVPVAEVLTFPMAGPAFVPVTGQAGPPRRDHVALAVPGKDWVIVIGGRNDAGVLGDSILYQGQMRTIGPGVIKLATPRHSATAFILGDDLVVAGGFDAAGVPIGNAEVFHTGDLMPRGVVPCSQRAGAAVIVLPNQMALLLGGTKADGLPTSVVEVYQPFGPR